MFGKRIAARLGNMRKPQEFIVYPRIGADETVTVQSDKSIGQFDPATGKGKLCVKGCYFPDLIRAVPYDFPPEFVEACKNAGAVTPTGGVTIG